MALLGDGRGGVYCENSLENPNHWNKNTRDEIKMEYFDVVMTNPPFGSKIPVKGEEILKQYDLGHSFEEDKKTGKYIKDKLKQKETPQILFIERCLQLLTTNGKLAVVLPDGILGNDSLVYLREWILDKAQILAAIDVPIETFMPYTSTKTSILILRKLEKDEVLEVEEVLEDKEVEEGVISNERRSLTKFGGDEDKFTGNKVTDEVESKGLFGIEVEGEEEIPSSRSEIKGGG